MSYNRREFLATTSSALAGTIIGATRLYGQPLSIKVDASSTADHFLPEQLENPILHQFANSAIDAAKKAGASYADIRVADQQTLHLYQWPGELNAGMNLYATYTYGLRVIVDGAWAFVHGNVPTIDAVVKSAQDAVVMARGYSGLIRHRAELAPAPATVGTWSTPIEIDPFTVPLMDQSALLGAYAQAASRVHSGAASLNSFTWKRETRVFASTSGALLTQRFYRSVPSVRVGGNRGLGAVQIEVPGIKASAAGYESLYDLNIQDRVKQAAEEAVRLSYLPVRMMEVGRYPIVIDGVTLGMIMGRTIGSALELDRVLGYEADASGTSFLSPPNELLGTQITTPLLTVTASRAMPSASAAKWDDEGAETRDHQVIVAGKLLNYHTSRETGYSLRSWYESQNQPAESNGCAIALDAGSPVQVRSPHLTITPSSSVTSVDDLCNGIKRGILLRNARALDTDQQLSSGNYTRSGILMEIENGKVVRRLDGNGLQFTTSAFFKSLTALGDSTTVCSADFSIYKGQPWQDTIQDTSAPAALFREINVVSTKWRI